MYLAPTSDRLVECCAAWGLGYNSWTDAANYELAQLGASARANMMVSMPQENGPEQPFWSGSVRGCMYNASLPSICGRYPHDFHSEAKTKTKSAPMENPLPVASLAGMSRAVLSLARLLEHFQRETCPSSVTYSPTMFLKGSIIPANSQAFSNESVHPETARF